jgi:imidazolonepropionase
MIRDGALLIENGRIVEIGPSRRVENLAQARSAREIDATGRVVMPGFVDCHTHLVCSAPCLDGFESRIAAAADALSGLDCTLDAVRNVSGKGLEARARQYVHGMIRHGTTTLEAKSSYGLDGSGELKILRVLRKLHRAPLDVVPTFLGPSAVPSAYEGNAAGYLSWMCSDLMPKIRRRGLARFADFSCDGRVFSAEQTDRCLEAARDLGFPLKIHTSQWQRNDAVRLAASLEAVSVDNLENASRSDVELLARSRTIAVLLPGSAFHLGRERYAPARDLIDAGAAVALATNFNPSTSPTYSLQMIVALACTRLRMSPAEAICAATVNAAYAIGCGQQAGSLETGKWGDLIVLNAADYREIPYHFGVNLVRLTMKRGAILYDEARVIQGPP